MGWAVGDEEKFKGALGIGRGPSPFQDEGKDLEQRVVGDGFPAPIVGSQIG